MNGRASVSQNYGSERQLVREAQAGDRRAVAYLLTEYPPVRALIGSLRRSIDPLNVARDELESAARLAVLEALGTFDGERGVKLTTYAYHFIRGAMLAELYPYVERRRKSEDGPQRVTLVSLKRGFDDDEGPGDNDGYESELLSRDPEYGIDPGFGRIEDGRPEAVRAFVATLPASQRAIVAAVFWGEQTHGQIAVARGVSRPAITRALTRVYERGAKELADHRLELAA
jgi:RNA polymerase sigma factor (sigma-70 family)